VTRNPNNIQIKKPPILFTKTQALIEKIETSLNGDFLSYWISSNGELTDEDVMTFYKLLESKPNKGTLFLYIKSDGGSGIGALRIVNLLRTYYKDIVALIAGECASAATMLALGANVIKMGPLAFLSAIDTSITHDMSPIDVKFNDKVSVSQNELDRVLKLWDQKVQKKDLNPYNSLYDFIHPLVFGSVDRASSLSIQLTKDILSYHMDDTEKSKHISNHLNSAYPSHSYPITLKEAQKVGLNAQNLGSELNAKLLGLNELYSEMAQRANTDFDEENYHDNEVLKIIEMSGQQFFYQQEKDWHYRRKERRYIPMNDDSSWRKAVLKDGQVDISKFHVR